MVAMWVRAGNEKVHLFTHASSDLILFLLPFTP